VTQENVHILRQLGQLAGPGVSVRAGFSDELKLPYLRLEAREGKEVLRALVLVSGADRGEVTVLAGAPNLHGVVAQELFRRPWIVRLHGSVP
jgi:hypothetical protein